MDADEIKKRIDEKNEKKLLKKFLYMNENRSFRNSTREVMNNPNYYNTKNCKNEGQVQESIDKVEIKKKKKHHKTRKLIMKSDVEMKKRGLKKKIEINTNGENNEGKLGSNQEEYIYQNEKTNNIDLSNIMYCEEEFDLLQTEPEKNFETTQPIKQNKPSKPNKSNKKVKTFVPNQAEQKEDKELKYNEGTFFSKNGNDQTTNEPKANTNNIESNEAYLKLNKAGSSSKFYISLFPDEDTKVRSLHGSNSSSKDSEEAVRQVSNTENLKIRINGKDSPKKQTSNKQQRKYKRVINKDSAVNKKNTESSESEKNELKGSNSSENNEGVNETKLVNSNETTKQTTQTVKTVTTNQASLKNYTKESELYNNTELPTSHSLGSKTFINCDVRYFNFDYLVSRIEGVRGG